MTELDDFHYQASGKWIVTGEHTVLRGGSALLFPLHNYQLSLSYKKTPLPLNYAPAGLFNPANISFIVSLIDSAMQLLPVRLPHLTGTLRVNNQIPMRAGMGASAALCVALSTWLYHLADLDTRDLFTYAKRLEDFFHGKSSGADIAVILAGTAISYQMNVKPEPLTPAWQPNWYLSFSGEPGSTRECITQVNMYHQEKPILAAGIDEVMQASVALAKQALLSHERNALSQLREAIELGGECFSKWGLVSTSLNTHLLALQDAGAIAAKPTGSGLGGYVLSLWETPPTQEIITSFNLISL